MKLSIIIPAYNREASIARTILSVSDRAVGDCEIIVVDDGSTDGTLLEARRAVAVLAGKVGARVLTQQNLGPGAARNLGSAHAKGSYLAFLDSDDFWFPDTLRSISEALNELSTNIKCGPTFLFLQTIDLEEGSRPGRISRTGCGPRLFASFLEAADTLRATRFASCNLIVRRDIFEDLHGFTDAVKCSEDTDLFLRAAESGSCAVLTDGPYLVHRMGVGDQLTDRFDLVLSGFRFLMTRDAEEVYSVGSAERRRLKDRFLAQCAAHIVRRSFAAGRAGLAYRLYASHILLLWRARNWHWLTRLPVIPLLAFVRPRSYSFGWRSNL